MDTSEKAVTPESQETELTGATLHADGYINMLTKYGTTQDSSESYQFIADPATSDPQLTEHYESNGLFAKIIDAPAEEALKHGFELNLKDKDTEAIVYDTLDDLEWEEVGATAIKWARLYGGALAVMIIDDGRSLDQPVNWRGIRGIEEIHVFERAIVQPDYTSILFYNQQAAGQGHRRRRSTIYDPESYQVSSRYGFFKVHESRCLVFRNGKLPENAMNSDYQYWGMPEFARIKRALRDTTISHGYATKMLERSVQAIYKMKGLSQLLSTDEGENQVVKRLQTIDLARSLLNSITVDVDGEEYDFKNFTFTGVKDVIDASCNMLSSLSNIPQTILFGRSPAGENSTGQSDLENWYNYLERIQKQMLKSNLSYLIDIILQAARNTGRIPEVPKYKLEFSPLWSMSEQEQASVDQMQAQTAYTKAQTAQLYVDMGALDPDEVRKGLAQTEDFNVEDLVTPEDLEWGVEGNGNTEITVELPSAGQSAPESDAKTMGVQVILPEKNADSAPIEAVNVVQPTAAACLVMKDGKILTGRRLRNGVGYICGPGGHIEMNESPEAACRREAQEEFGITLGRMTELGTLTDLPEEYGVPVIYLCMDYSGVPVTDGKEMGYLEFRDPVSIRKNQAFEPFYRSLSLLLRNNFGENAKKDLPSAKTVPIINLVEGETDSYNPDQPRDKDGKFGSGGGGASGGGESEGSSTGEGEPSGGGPAFHSPSASEFNEHFNAARDSVQEKDRWRVAQDYDDSQYEHMDRYETDGGSTFAIHDGDIVSVCHSADDPVRGKELMQKAVEAGGTKLDSYDGNHGFYQKCGFEPTSWCKWSDEYAPADWKKANGLAPDISPAELGRIPDSALKVGREDIIFYRYTGRVSAGGAADFKSRVPASEDYDAAYSARDAALQGGGE